MGLNPDYLLKSFLLYNIIYCAKILIFFSFHFRGAAKNTFYLKKAGVTHVLNTAEGTRQGLVDTNQNFYRPFGIKYKGLKLLDVAQTNIAMYFSEVAEFIDEALQSGGEYQIIWKELLTGSNNEYFLTNQNESCFFVCCC